MKRAIYTFVTFAALAALSPLLTADEQADRAGLNGSWVQSGGPAAWIISAAPDGLHMTQIEGSNKVADFQCNLEGKDCEVKIGGHKATVSLYYNGAALVQLETKGGQIVKRRFSVLPGGNSMKVEITPMTESAARTEERDFHRGDVATRKK